MKCLVSNNFSHTEFLDQHFETALGILMINFLLIFTTINKIGKSAFSDLIKEFSSPNCPPLPQVGKTQKNLELNNSHSQKTINAMQHKKKYCIIHTVFNTHELQKHQSEY